MNPGLGMILFGGIGYVLVYASVANRGRFATHPWAGLLMDAYTSDGAPAGGSSSSPSEPPPASSGGGKAPAHVKHGRSALGTLEQLGGDLAGVLPIPGLP